MAEDERTLFTIGHSTHELAEFLRLLNVHGVEAVADVRSQPVSRLTHFERDELADALAAERIEYVFATEYFDDRGIEEWRSLQLLRPPSVRFQRDPRNAERWRALFEHGRTRYSLRVTDPLCTAKLDAGVSVRRDCLLTVSLGGPWAPCDGSRAEACYKLVAAVIELRQGR
jgi:hypothetical protein